MTTMQIPATIHELELTLVRKYPVEQVLAKLKLQLEKDFEKAGLNLELSHNSAPNDYIQAVQICINQLSSSVLQQVLYLIDLPEPIYLATLNLNDQYQKLAETIVYREFVKVYYQLHYQR